MGAYITAGGAIVTGVVVALLGYALGVRRSRLERITERRDTAVAEIFGAMIKNQRAFISWSAQDNSATQRAARENYDNFLDCYYTRSIWLQEATREAVNAYLVAVHDFIIRLENDRVNSGRLADGTIVEELLNQKLTPNHRDAEDKLRKELELGPSWWRKMLGLEDKQAAPRQRSNDSA